MLRHITFAALLSILIAQYATHVCRHERAPVFLSGADIAKGRYAIHGRHRSENCSVQSPPKGVIMPQEFKKRCVLVSPNPGFVVKTTTTHPGFYTPTSPPSTPSYTPSTPTSPPRLSVPASLKIFINVTYASAIPVPPTTSVLKMSPAEEDSAIRRAMDGDEHSPYFVPVVVSTGRPDTDKAGKPSLVFDAILHTSLKLRMTKDMDFRAFVLEIILSHVESPPHSPSTPPPRSLVLSRTLATPNIRAKGALDPREVDVPDFGQVEQPDTQTKATPAAPKPEIDPENGSKKKPLVEEIPAAEPKMQKSILKKSGESSFDLGTDAEMDPHLKTEADAGLETPAWRWESTKGNQPNKLVVETPKLTRSDHARSTLSLSPDVLTLRTPAYFLQLSLDMDVEIERARAEWRVGQGRLLVYV